MGHCTCSKLKLTGLELSALGHMQFAFGTYILTTTLLKKFALSVQRQMHAKFRSSSRNETIKADRKSNLGTLSNLNLGLWRCIWGPTRVPPAQTSLPLELLTAKTMIAFTSFPVSSDELSTGYSTTRHHPDVEADISMDLDDDFEAGGSKVTYPGESLTSAQAFMR